MGYEYQLDSTLVKSTQERCLNLQDSILHLKSKHVLTARCLMSLIRSLTSMEKMVPEGRLHMRPFQFHLKEHWRSSVIGHAPALVRDNFSSPRVVAKSHKCDERRRPSTQRPQYPNLYRRLKRRLGRSHRASLYKGFVVRQGKRLHINVLELKAVSLALQRFKDQCQNQTVLVATDNSTVVAYVNKQGSVKNGSLLM